MKKLTKATIAAAAGVSLLLGTGGTLAYWNDSVTAGTATITAGDLRFVSNATTSSWTVTHQGGDVETFTTAQFEGVKIVPGDVVAYKTDMSVSALGHNLKFQATPTPGSITAVTPDATGANAALVTALMSSLTLKISSSSSDVDVTDDGIIATVSSKVGDTAKTYPLTVTATVTWPFGAEGEGNPARNGSVSLAGFGVQLDQISGN